jgi:hypothetical protein
MGFRWHVKVLADRLINEGIPKHTRGLLVLDQRAAVLRLSKNSLQPSVKPLSLLTWR